MGPRLWLSLWPRFVPSLGSYTPCKIENEITLTSIWISLSSFSNAHMEILYNQKKKKEEKEQIRKTYLWGHWFKTLNNKST